MNAIYPTQLTAALRPHRNELMNIYAYGRARHWDESLQVGL